MKRIESENPIIFNGSGVDTDTKAFQKTGSGAESNFKS